MDEHIDDILNETESLGNIIVVFKLTVRVLPGGGGNASS